MYFECKSSVFACSRMFLQQSVMEQRILFEIKLYVPNATTWAALSEFDEMKKDKTKYKRYSSFAEILTEA